MNYPIAEGRSFDQDPSRSAAELLKPRNCGFPVPQLRAAGALGPVAERW